MCDLLTAFIWSQYWQDVPGRNVATTQSRGPVSVGATVLFTHKTWFKVYQPPNISSQVPVFLSTECSEYASFEHNSHLSYKKPHPKIVQKNELYLIQHHMFLLEINSYGCPVTGKSISKNTDFTHFYIYYYWKFLNSRHVTFEIATVNGKTQSTTASVAALAWRLIQPIFTFTS